MLAEPCLQVRDLGMARASDLAIFTAAASQARVLMTKDRDFAELVDRIGPLPAIILLTLGNTSTARVKEVLEMRLPIAMSLIASGEPLVEIGGDI